MTPTSFENGRSCVRNAIVFQGTCTVRLFSLHWNKS